MGTYDFFLFTIVDEPDKAAKRHTMRQQRRKTVEVIPHDSRQQAAPTTPESPRKRTVVSVYNEDPHLPMECGHTHTVIMMHSSMGIEIHWVTTNAYSKLLTAGHLNCCEKLPVHAAGSGCSKLPLTLLTLLTLKKATVRKKNSGSDISY